MYSAVMEKLDAYLKSQKISRAAFARTIGCAPSTMTELMQGKYPPTLAVALAIERATKRKVKCEDLNG